MKNENEILEEFLKSYYRKNSIPNEIILNEKIETKNLEEFFFKEYNSKTKIINPQKGVKKKLIELAIKNLEIDLNFNLENSIKKKLNLKFTPNIIECFDMSNLGHKDLVGAMTRWKNGLKDKPNFRKYQIKSFENYNDDYQSFREVIFRRYSTNSNLTNLEIGKIMSKFKLKNFNKTKSFIELPNLIICDGGIGQLNSTIQILKELKLYEKVDVISLAKKEEIIYKYENEELVNFDLNNNSLEMIYIIKIRNSVHNFVKSYNVSKRKIK